MGITSSDIKTLREMTNAGMMDCKKALVDANGDLQEAQKLLKERGIIAASKRSGRSTNEGRIACTKTDAAAAILELGCETDFVARNETFVQLAQKLAEKLLDASVGETELQQIILETSSTIKENIQIHRKQIVAIQEDEYVSTYLHGETANAGALIKLRVGDASKRSDVLIQTLAHDIALHATAFQPPFLSPKTVPESYLTEQKEIITVQIKNMGKPEAVAQKIAEGKLGKHFKEVCLTEQAFVKNDKISVAQHIAEVSKQLGASITLETAIVYKVGTML